MKNDHFAVSRPPDLRWVLAFFRTHDMGFTKPKNYHFSPENLRNCTKVVHSKLLNISKYLGPVLPTSWWVVDPDSHWWGKWLGLNIGKKVPLGVRRACVVTWTNKPDTVMSSEIHNSLKSSCINKSTKSISYSPNIQWEFVPHLAPGLLQEPGRPHAKSPEHNGCDHPSGLEGWGSISFCGFCHYQCLYNVCCT